MQQSEKKINTVLLYTMMYIVVLVVGVWSMCCRVGYASQLTKQHVRTSVGASLSVGETMSVAISSPIVNGTEKLTTPNLDAIDNSADNLMQLKRRLEIERAQMELKRLHSEGVGAGKVDINLQEDIQTIVTGVAINKDGVKMAWLQFADGGSLTVNIGSKIGKYIVTDITLDGVQLSYIKNKIRVIKHHRLVMQQPRVQNIYLKRVYAAAEKSKNRSSINNNALFTPSPIITGANAVVNSTEMVPPIRPLR